MNKCTLCVYPFGQRSLWLAYAKIPLSLSSFYIGNPNICKHKKQNTIKIKNGPCHYKTGQKNNKKKKYKNKNKMCRGGGPIFSICLITNTMPKLEQSSLQPSTDLHHRQLLQTTSYNHLLLLHLLISRKGKLKQQQARNSP